MHVDASVMVAIIVREEGYADLASRLASASRRTTSPVSVLETIIAIGKQVGDRSAGLLAAREFLEAADVEIEPADGDLVDGLADAHLRYGKGSGSPARLNLGDCFSYALAKRAGVPLLYKGEDFAHTDLA
jgi:ribonuclease VapC